MKSSDTACRAIRAASTESQVMKAVSEYVDSLAPGAVALLPVELISLGVSGAEEVIHSALHLVNSRMVGSEGSDADTLSDVVLVLSTAARRLAALAKNTA